MLCVRRVPGERITIKNDIDVRYNCTEEIDGNKMASITISWGDKTINRQFVENDRFEVDENVILIFTVVRGSFIKICVDAPREIPVWRYELRNTVGQSA